jgi:hypothetical protein
MEYFSHTEFLGWFTEHATISSPVPVYKYIHVMNTHRPMVVDAACQFAGRALPDEREHLLNQSRCTLNTLLPLFQRLRQLGVYDPSLIIVNADHGGWVGNRRTGRTRRGWPIDNSASTS